MATIGSDNLCGVALIAQFAAQCLCSRGGGFRPGNNAPAAIDDGDSLAWDRLDRGDKARQLFRRGMARRDWRLLKKASPERRRLIQQQGALILRGDFYLTFKDAY